jgi:hypothetical protein
MAQRRKSCGYSAPANPAPTAGTQALLVERFFFALRKWREVALPQDEWIQETVHHVYASTSQRVRNWARVPLPSQDPCSFHRRFHQDRRGEMLHRRRPGTTINGEREWSFMLYRKVNCLGSALRRTGCSTNVRRNRRWMGCSRRSGDDGPDPYDPSGRGFRRPNASSLRRELPLRFSGQFAVAAV